MPDVTCDSIDTTHLRQQCNEHCTLAAFNNDAKAVKMCIEDFVAAASEEDEDED